MEKYKVLLNEPTHDKPFVYGIYNTLNKAQHACLCANRLLFHENKYNQNNFAYVLVEEEIDDLDDLLPF